MKMSVNCCIILIWLGGIYSAGNACDLLGLSTCINGVDFTDVKNLCSSYSHIQQCITPFTKACRGNPAYMAITSPLANVHSLCDDNGCSIAKLTQCTNIMVGVRVESIPTSNRLSDACSKVMAYTSCLQPLKEPCSKVTDANIRNGLQQALSSASLMTTFCDAKGMNFSITKTWDGKSLDYAHEIRLEGAGDKGVKIIVDGPFFDDPGNPGGTPGQPFPGLWDYEVVEAFFLNDHDQYLEVELCPHGQHLLLLLKGVRDAFKQQLPLNFTSSITGATWHGEAYIPPSYFPPEVSKFNAYAIHGSGSNRTYEALYPVPTGKFTNPDFHRLDYFQPINFASLLQENWNSAYSSNEWATVLNTNTTVS